MINRRTILHIYMQAKLQIVTVNIVQEPFSVLHIQFIKHLKWGNYTHKLTYI